MNNSYQFALDRFREACQEQFGIKPINDDKLILKSFIDFETYIKSYEKLDHTIHWHKTLINSMVKAKIRTLKLKLIKNNKNKL